jgi:glycosyltransferase involved in cell wall biosynthesis
MSAPKLLIVSHDFPPSTGTSGRRPARLSKFLAERGAPPAVVTAAPEFYGGAVMAEPCIRDELRVFEVPHRRSYRFLERAGGPGRQAENLALVMAYRRAIERALEADAPPDFMYFLGVPFWYFPLARRFHARWGIPYVLEFGDVFYMRGVTYRMGQRSGLRQLMDCAAEAWAVARASLVIHTTESQTRLYRQRYSSKPPGDFMTVPWGFDDDLLRNMPPEPRGADEALRVAIFGKFAAYGVQDARALARAVGGFHARHRVEVLHLGDPEPALADAFRREGLSGRFRQLGMQPYVEGLRLLASAHCLVLNAISDVSLPVKVFDYIGVNRPILAFVRPESEAGRLLARFSGAFIARTPGEAEGALLTIAEQGLEELQVGLDTAEFGQQRHFERLLERLGFEVILEPSVETLFR